MIFSKIKNGAQNSFLEKKKQKMAISQIHLVLDKTHHLLICDSRGLFESQLVFFFQKNP